MSDFTVNLKIDLGGLTTLGQDVLQTGARGLSQGAEFMKEHANADHGPEAHGVGRYQNRTGSLSKSIKVIPVVIRKDGAFTGIIAYKEYAGFVEQGTTRSRAYPYMVPAMTDPKVQAAIIDRLEKVFKRKYG